MKRVGAYEAKAQLSKLLANVESKGLEIVIQRRGKDIAVLLPYGEYHQHHAQDVKTQVLEGLREVRASFKKIPGEESIRLKDWIVEGRKR